MLNNPLLPLYSILKDDISEYQKNENNKFDDMIEDMRINHFPSNFNNKYDGKTFQSKNSGEFKVLEYFNYDKIAIQFLNSGYRMVARANNISKGEVKDPYAISIMGVGYIGVGPYKTDGSIFERMIYSRWRGILDRVYIKHEGNKTVHPEWHCFQYFAAWFYANYYEVPYVSMYEMVVDKDLLYPMNEEYSPYKCLILPASINTKIQLKDRDRELLTRYFSNELTEQELNELMLRKKYREMSIKTMAERNKMLLPPRVYIALMNYKMF